jgi:hypothetical protein
MLASSSIILMIHNVGTAAFSLKHGLRNPCVFIAWNRNFLVKPKLKVIQYKYGSLALRWNHN